jgi:hypothetical protein
MLIATVFETVARRHGCGVEDVMRDYMSDKPVLAGEVSGMFEFALKELEEIREEVPPCPTIN